MGLKLPVLVTVTLPFLAGLVLLAGRRRWRAIWPGAAPMSDFPANWRPRPRSRAKRPAGAELSRQALHIESKAGNEPVTEADKAANTLILQRLGAAFPDDTILSEEVPDSRARLGRGASGWSIRSTAPATSSWATPASW